MFRYNAGVDDVEGKPKKIKPRSFPAETPRAPATAPSRRGLQKDSKEQVTMSHTLTLTHTHILYPNLNANLNYPYPYPYSYLIPYLHASLNASI